MEKYSRFRDSGTGIQVFLTPVPPATSASPLAHVFLLPALIFGVARVLLLLIFVPLWYALSSTIGSSNRGVDAVLHGVLGRISLLILGFSLVKTENVSLRNRGRAAAALASNKGNSFQPKKGDLIFSNFSSWLDIIYAAIHFNPVFVLPVVAPGKSSGNTTATNGAKPSPARRRNAGASVVTDMNARSTSTSTNDEKRFLGFEKVSLWRAVAHAGRTPLVYGQDVHGYQDLSDLVKDTPGPLMVFPELVTSNNRGLLKMAPIFPPSWKDLYKVTGSLRMGQGQPDFFIMSIKHEPPSTINTSTTYSTPSSRLNPLSHLWQLCSSLSFSKGFTVRLLDPTESPTSSNYTADANAAIAAKGAEDALAEAVGNLISGLSRLRRTGLGWQDKEVFLELFKGAKK
ncbi:unnamed protein product [Sympodiomycopsis kandeliae]